MANLQWSRQPVQDVWLTYTAYSPCVPCIHYVSSECMHQIWSTKFTTCTWRMANVKWSIRRVQDIWLTYTSYSPCSPSVPYVSSVIFGLWCAPNLVLQVYDLYLAYGLRTIRYTTRTWRMAYVQWIIRPVQIVWLTYTAYSPCTPSISYVSSVIYGLMYAPNLVHEVYDLYLAYC